MGIGGIIIALLIFQAGMFVGYRKASFSYRWGDNYHRTFGEQQKFPFRMGPRGDFSESHGVVGKVVSIKLPTFVVEGSDNVEKVVVIKEDTIIRRFRDTLKPEDLKTGDLIVVIGSPNNQSEVEAKLIRMLPPQ